MILYRSYTERGTFGKLFKDNGDYICYTMERSWKGNRKFISCVPEGDYGLQEYNSVKYPNTYALVNTDLGVSVYDTNSQRSHILIHAANVPNELSGCIAPGMGYGCFANDWGVSYSRAALRRVLAVAAVEGILSIRQMTADIFYKDVATDT